MFLPFGNRLEFFAELLAIWRLGGCAVPIDARLTAFEVETLARAAQPRLAVVDDATDPGLIGALAATAVDVVATTDTGSEQAGACRSRLDDDALILFTSGSTGDPKGVLHTHRSLRARWISLRDNLGVAAFERTLCLLPTHFGHGLICNACSRGCRVSDLFVTPPFRPELIMRARQPGRRAPHQLPVVGAVGVAAGAEDGARRRKAERSAACTVGSAPLAAQTWERHPRLGGHPAGLQRLRHHRDRQLGCRSRGTRRSRPRTA